MNFCYNLPPCQRGAQRLIEQFNNDEALWSFLGQRRQRRRKLRLTKEQRRALDLLDFELHRPPDDCIAFRETL